MWDTIIVRPLINLLLFFYQYLGHETMLSVALVTLLVRLLVMPLMLNSQKSMRRQQGLKPKMDEIQRKYKDDPERQRQEQMKLFQESGINPLGGCLPMLIQLPLMIGVYQSIIRALAATPLQLLALSNDIYKWIPSFSQLLPLKSQFLWLDLALPDPFLVLPFLVFATTWFSQKLVTPPATDAQSEAMNKNMLLMMPVMMAFFSATYASGLAIYLLISNLLSILQYYLFRKHYQFDTPDATKPAKSPPAIKAQAAKD
ncbi:MAG: membrane protein insertase YidC [Anaerolineae bacterium]|nr:membrane protein insertase YidC [Anaerolineae bacterium]